MKTLRLILVLLAAAGMGGAARAVEGNRYLVVVQVSKEMKPALPAVRACLRSLLASDMNQQLRSGDTLGLWTYDHELHAGEFPMQIWAPGASADIAKRADGFLEQQRCKGDPRIAEMLPAVFRVVEGSEAITVLLFTDGFEPVQGTPFDAVINRVFAEHRAELRKAHVPFVSVLQARGGKIIHCTMHSAAGPVTIPAPPLPKPAPPVVVPPKLAVPPASLKTNPPLILDYSRPATNAARPAPKKLAGPVLAVKPPVPVTMAAVGEVTRELPHNINDTNGRGQLTPANSGVPAAAVVKVAPAPVAIQPAGTTAVGSTPVTEDMPTPDRGAGDSAGNGWLWLAGGLAGVMIVLAWLILRARSQRQASAITESIERRKR